MRSWGRALRSMICPSDLADTFAAASTNPLAASTHLLTWKLLLSRCKFCELGKGSRSCGAVQELWPLKAVEIW